MFNRAIQMRLINTTKEEIPKTEKTDKHFEGKAAIVGYHLERFVLHVGVVGLSYVIVDTVRKVLVAKASK